MKKFSPVAVALVSSCLVFFHSNPAFAAVIDAGATPEDAASVPLEEPNDGTAASIIDTTPEEAASVPNRRPRKLAAKKRGWRPDEHFCYLGLYCASLKKCISTTTACPASIQVYEGSWQLVLTDGTISIKAGTSWSDSESWTIGKSFTNGFTEGVGTKFGTTKVTAGASQTMQSTSTSTISDTKSGNFGISCTTAPCTGRLYQWQQAALYNNSAPAQIVKSCSFTCVPNSTSKDPQCPLQFCETGGCQCCNAAWMLDSNSTTANHLAPSAGGNCTAKCGPNGVACTDNDE